MIRRILPVVLAIQLLTAAPSAAQQPGAPAPLGEGAPAPRPVYAVEAASPDAGAASESGGAAKVVGVLRTTDKAQANRYVPKVFELEHANPYEVSKFVEDTVRAEGGMIGTYANPETGSNSGLIVVVVPEYQLETIGQLIKDLDQPDLTNSEGTAWDFINLKHRNVEDPQFQDSLLAFGGADNRIVRDVKTNSMMLTGVPSGVDAIRAALIDYDVPRDQISIEVKIFEIDVSNDASLGLNYLAWKNGPGRNLFKYDRNAIYIRTDGVPTRGRSNTAGYSLDYPSEFFDFLVVKGKARMVTELKGTVINGYLATFKVQDEILYYRVDQTESGSRVVMPETKQRFTPRASEVEEIKRFESGITLTIKPVIFRNNIDLAIETEIKDYVNYEDTGEPVSNDRMVKTQVRAVSGEEVLLATMQRTRDIHATRKWPLLGSIPVIGYLFGGEIGGKKQTSVVEIGTPRIITEQALEEDDQTTVDQVDGKTDLVLPEDSYFFDQYLLDK